MSAYGYVPLPRAHELREPYSIASPSTWTFTRQQSANPTDVQHFGGVEDHNFTPAQCAELTALGGGYFPSAQAFTAWLNTYV